jgi:hypothetical protein
MRTLKSPARKLSIGCRWLLMLSLLSWIEPAAAKLKVDVVLLLDTSASMLTTDPEELRMEAIRLFLSLLGEDDRVAVMGFDASARLLSDFRFLASSEKTEIDRLIREQGQANGAFTNLRDPAEKALERLQNRRADALPLVIMLTDGKMDLGDPDLDRRLGEDLRDKIIPSYRRSGVRLYCLAFSGKSDFGFLESLARPTGGAAWNSEYADELKHLFASLFLAIKQPETLSVRGGRFRVDANVRELTGATEGGRLSLESPSGKLYAAREGESVIRVQNPETGEWGVKGVENTGMVFVNRDAPQAASGNIPPPPPSAPAPPPAAARDNAKGMLDASEPEVLLAMRMMLWGNAILFLGFGLFFIVRRIRSKRSPPTVR